MPWPSPTYRENPAHKKTEKKTAFIEVYETVGVDFDMRNLSNGDKLIDMPDASEREVFRDEYVDDKTAEVWEKMPAETKLRYS